MYPSNRYFCLKVTLALNGEALEASLPKSTSWPFSFLFNLLVELLANAFRQEK